MNKKWKETLKTKDMPEIDSAKKKKAIEELKIQIEATTITVKENYMQKIKRYFPYINKSTFLIQFIVLIMGMFVITSTTYEKTRLILSTVMPVLAFLQIMELQKSFKYNMYEIEMSCKMDLKELISMKLIISTVINLCIMTIFACMTGIEFECESYLLIIYFLVPFIITNIINIKLTKLLKNKSNEITNITAMLLVNIVLFVLNMNFPYVYEAASSLVWIMLLVITTLYFIKLIMELYEKEEEYIWNLQ